MLDGRIFRWKYSSWVVALFGGGALTAALASQFALAYFGFAVTGVWIIGAWLTSEKLKNRRAAYRDATAPRVILVRSAKNLSNENHNGNPALLSALLLWHMVPVLAIFAVFYGISLWVRNIQIGKELEASQGWLYPANEHVETPCRISTSHGLILLIGNSAFLTDTFPHTVIAIHCARVLTLERDEHGNIGINFTIRDREGKIIVDIEHGFFDVNKNNSFRFDRHRDRRRSTLSVIDQYGNEALYLHMANRNVLEMRANIYINGTLLRLDETHPPIPGVRGYICSEDSGYADVQIGQCLVR